MDKAESEPAIAYAVNGSAVGVLGEWAAHNGVPLIHFSTDYVFDGQASEPYDESHPVSPLSVYGKSKLEGERLLLRTGAHCLIVRTAWVYSATGKNFLKTMVRLAAERDELAVVSDQVGTPTSADQIAKFIRSRGQRRARRASGTLRKVIPTCPLHSIGLDILAWFRQRDRRGNGASWFSRQSNEGQSNTEQRLSDASRAAQILAFIGGPPGTRFRFSCRAMGKGFGRCS